MTVYVVLVFLSVLCGMAVSVKAFGTGGKRSKVFEDIYFSVEDVDGVGIIYTKTGDYSALMEISNPVQKYSADTDSYYEYSQLFTKICQSLGEGYILQKQDIFIRKSFNAKEFMKGPVSVLSQAYFRYFNGRKYTDVKTVLCITQENKKSRLFTYDSKKWNEFLDKLSKVHDQFHDAGLKAQFLDVEKCRDYVDRYFAMNFRDPDYSMSNFKVDGEDIWMGDKQCRVFSLVDVDSICLPTLIRPYSLMTVNNSEMPVDLLAGIDSIPGIESAVYNQVIFMPNQKKELGMLDKKKNRHSSIPSPSNQLAVEDIKNVQNIIARENKQLVYAHFNLVVTVSKDSSMARVTNYLENFFSKMNIQISKRAYNQLELFVSSFPGNCSQLNPDYDRFLTLSDAALCMMYKECQQKSEKTPLKFWYTDRQGVPICMDFTGKEGAEKMTDNCNYFVLGPSGSGKSFFMNTVMRQFFEQLTDVVIVDVGNSYQVLCQVAGGVYISYTKEHPISMNPFKVTKEEYDKNFDEKKNFIKSLIFLIYKGQEEYSKVQETILNKVVFEYYEEYFHPFDGFSKQEREELRERLRLADKTSGAYEKFVKEQNEKFRKKQEEKAAETKNEQPKEEAASPVDRTMEKIQKLRNLANDPAAAEGEVIAATRQIQRLLPETMQDRYLMEIDRRIDEMEERRKELRVTNLSFNSFYEFSLQRIPQLQEEMNLDSSKFDVHDYAAVLSTFYKGGEYEETLNSDMETSLFDERFIVFELDQIKDNPVLAPIVLLIIMDVFTQKMRIKKCRKTLVIEEAWKAIATPSMAEYIQYLYKTARKHWASVGVVTQDIQDITGNKIVKDAIISNSGVFVLLDQSKFKEKFAPIADTLALTETDIKKIFTINRLENKEGRGQFKEVFIKRGNVSFVIGVEEPHECYMAYTTEKIEKEGLMLYHDQLHCDFEEAIRVYCQDWERSGIQKPIEFAQRVKAEGRVLNLPPKKFAA